jgi:hypothetical protein
MQHWLCCGSKEVAQERSICPSLDYICAGQTDQDEEHAAAAVAPLQLHAEAVGVKWKPSSSGSQLCSLVHIHAKLCALSSKQN